MLRNKTLKINLCGGFFVILVKDFLDGINYVKGLCGNEGVN